MFKLFINVIKKVTIGEYFIMSVINSITTSGSIDEKLDVIRTGEKQLIFTEIIYQVK